MIRRGLTMPDDSRSAVVVDASAAIAIIRREPHARAILQALQDERPVAVRGLVPDLFWLEVANVLVGRYAAAVDDVVEAFRELVELALETISADRSVVLTTLDLQARHRLSAYDAVYLALAITEDARLLTLDAQLAGAAGHRAIWLEGMGGRRLSEDRAAYGNERVDWSRFGPYLAKLRAEAREAAGRASGIRPHL